MRQTRIDTGDNKEKGKKALKDACRLVEAHGAKLIAPVSDRVGRKFAYRFNSRYGREFYLVARSVEPYGRDELVSTQAWLVKAAANKNAPLVMLISKKGLMVFNPQTVLRVVYGDNMRRGERYVNWEYWYGQEWEEDKNLFEVWRKLQPVGATPQGLPLSMFSGE